MYGGRVIDDFDRRIVKTFMNEYMGDFLFDTFQPFHFYQDEAVDYTIPCDGTREDYIGKLLLAQLKLYWVRVGSCSYNTSVGEKQYV